MSIKIEVVNAEIKIKSGVAAKSGKPYTIREQEAWAVTVGRDGQPNKYPQKVSINLGDNAPAYAPGNYTIAAESFYVDRFGNLALGLILRPLVAAAAPARAAA